MLSVCLCGSFRFYDEMATLRHGLDARGIICEWPMPGAQRDPQAMSPDEARDAITRHLERIDRADLVFVFDPGGYVGNSVAMEIGYAYARRKPIYLLAPLHDPFLMSLVTAVVSLGDLMQLLQAWVPSHAPR
jgi:nucleoside 2-deoxyribosyltransferase